MTAMSGEKSVEALVQDNLGLVHSCSHRFKGRGIDYDDLFQAGCMGLVKAAKAFEPEPGQLLFHLRRPGDFRRDQTPVPRRPAP